MSAMDIQGLGMVPMVIETSGRGERAYDIYSRLLPKSMANLSPQALRALGMAGQDNDLGMNIGKVQVLSGKGAQDAPFFVNGTSMRIELPAPLASGGEIRWRNLFVHEIGADEAAKILAETAAKK